MIYFVCSGCGKTLGVKDELGGRKARCPSCAQLLVIPQPTAAPSEGQVVAGTAGPYPRTAPAASRIEAPAITVEPVEEEPERPRRRPLWPILVEAGAVLLGLVVRVLLGAVRVNLSGRQDNPASSSVGDADPPARS